MVILSKGCKPDNFNFDKSLKLNSANIQGLRSNFVECEFFLKLSWHCCSMWDKLGWLKWFWQFFCKGIGYLPLIWKDSYFSYAWSCSLCERWTSFCTGLISRKLCGFLCFQLALLHSVSYFFFLYWSLSLLLCLVFDSISSNVDEILFINPSANVFVFGDLNVHHKDWLTYSGGTERPGKLFYNFSISNDLMQMVNFPTQISVTLTVLLFWIYLFLLTLVFVLQWLSLHWEILIMLLSQLPLTFQ